VKSAEVNVAKINRAVKYDVHLEPTALLRGSGITSTTSKTLGAIGVDRPAVGRAARARIPREILYTSHRSATKV
jgi:hypothetical protein